MRLCQQETLLAFSGIRAVCMMQLCFFLQVARQFAAPECNFYSYKGVYNYAPYRSCPLISRQGLYLKLTLPADVDILAESDNPTYSADGFHCNVRSPLQDYAMPFLHSVSA